ncbi:MAG: 23S rRNA (pseudouridine(1915)-N(3))-methyltransferase RlmH, partial [Eubacteriales bacterium]|nr:23S rRNA (pseudouridine(1915)-N(3))-methyltransferase RlmH [Eubacteriales bacterium]
DGKMLDSVEISRLMSVKMTEGVSEITFVIGGSNGVSDKVKNRADFKTSFGKVTYPHQLMRVILSEQIYRAFSIMNNLPYHK